MLKPNEQVIYDFLKEQKKPIKLSALEIGKEVTFKKFKWTKKEHSWHPSRQAVLAKLKNLQKKGVITLDYSDPWNPKIIINR